MFDLFESDDEAKKKNSEKLKSSSRIFGRPGYGELTLQKDVSSQLPRRPYILHDTRRTMSGLADLITSQQSSSSFTPPGEEEPPPLLERSDDSEAGHGAALSS